MGISASWIAVEGADFQAVLKALELEDTGRPDPDIIARFSGASLPSGWVIVVANRKEWATSERLSHLSEMGRTVGSFVEEHVMVSTLRAFKNGAEIWSVHHDGGEKGRDHLMIGGAPPPELADIVEGLKRQQADHASDQVDYMFDVPVELGALLCGFRQDDKPIASFTTLEPIRRKSWLSRLFSGSR